MGTFIIYPTFSANQQSGVWVGGHWDDGSYLLRSNANLVTAINQLTSTGVAPNIAPNDFILGCGKFAGGDPNANIGTFLVRFGYGAGQNNIALDGGAAIDAAQLPAGFQTLTATLKVSGASGVITAGGGKSLFLQHDTLTELDLTSLFNSTPAADKYQFPYTAGDSILDILFDGYGIKCTFQGVSDFALFYGGKITGTYGIVGGSWTLEPPSTVEVGDQVTISGTDDLDEVEEIIITKADGSGSVSVTVFNSQSPTEVIFTIPTSLGTYEGDVYISLDGTDPIIFTGPVFVGPLTIFIADSSGIYKLVAGKTNDTLYVSTHTGDDTVDVKIPDPFVKTGFVP